MNNSNWIAIILAIILLGLLIWIIVSQVKDYFRSKNPKLAELKQILKTAVYDGNKKLFTDNFVDSLGFYEGDKSYTINKEKVYLCLYDKDGDYYNLNTLLYVLLHELSHVLNDEIGHTEKFHQIFDDLLEKAARAVAVDINGNKTRVYNYSIPVPTDYCMY